MKRPLVQLNLRSSSSRSPAGSKAASLMSKSAMRHTVKVPGRGPPIRKPRMLPSLSRPRSEIAISVPRERLPARHGDQRFEALVVRQRAHARRDVDRVPARGQAILAVVEADDPVDALDADIERAAVLRDRLGVVPAPRRQRFAIGAKDRRHLGVDDAGRTRSGIGDAPAQPPALVAGRDELLAIGLHA